MILLHSPTLPTKKSTARKPSNVTQKSQNGNNLQSENFCATTFDAKLLFLFLQ